MTTVFTIVTYFKVMWYINELLAKFLNSEEAAGDLNKVYHLQTYFGN